MRRCVPVVLLILIAASSSSGQERARKATVLQTIYEVDPRFEKVIADQIARARAELAWHREQKKLIADISTPISSRGGSHEPTNLAIAAAVKKRLEAYYGSKGFYALDPGAFALPSVAGRKPEGGEYLYMWTEILAGPDGKGTDFDLVYFVGPSDVAMFFGAKRRNPGDDSDGGLLGSIDRYIDQKAVADEAFRKEVAADPERRQAYRRFYALRASAAYSKGAHDEWNLFVRINRKRGVGNQIACSFDGRALSPAEMETEISPGYEMK